ncbi:MAG: acyl-CoA carboxylase subunit beta [Pirellulales bacterium]|nr:acyl-CoA carboxylase subunit beta [Pirellulales bacterium]
MAEISKLQERIADLTEQERLLRQGGGAAAIAKQHAKQRGTPRERINQLLDPGSPVLELGLWAGWQMYDQWGGAPAAGVVTLIGMVAGRRQMIIANDATVKAGAFFPATAKKVLRAQKIAFQNRLPLIYLVDSAGVFLPLQEDVFPDEDDFGRIFRNNAVLSAAGIPQLAAIMGNCVAGGGYLPVLCDQLLMVEGSGLYLAGPALVKSAIGQETDHETLGGAGMHARMSGTIDARFPDEASCLQALRDLCGMAREDAPDPAAPFTRGPARDPARDPATLETFLTGENQGEYDIRAVLRGVVDAESWAEYKPEYGQTVVCGMARIGGYPVGIVANQKQRVKNAEGRYEFGGVLYVESAEKAARFVMLCNQQWLPLVFLQDVNGFMVGKESEQAGIIKAGAKLVNAISNSRVPKVTVITGGSFGAGNYALCGKAFDPRFIFGWPLAKCAVMGGAQATNTLTEVMQKSLTTTGQAPPDKEAIELLRAQVQADYQRQMDVRYAAAHGWVDAIITPVETRGVLIQVLDIVTRSVSTEPSRWGVFQV